MKKMNVHYLANNQVVVVSLEEYIFFSYNTQIAEYNLKEKKLVLSEKWNFSRTTLKYLSVFFENYDILCGKVSLGTGFKKSVENLIKNGEITVEKE